MFQQVRVREDPRRVKCHQCGNLFSGDTSAPSCDNFDPDSSQTGFCDPGEACLWYSWYLSDTQVSVIRECLSTSILLGSIEDPLVVTPGCTVKDISEDGTKAEACLCDSDLCNDNSLVGDTMNSDKISQPQQTQLAAPVQTETEAVISTARRVRCYQCGSLFSDSGSPVCDQFSPGNNDQQGHCDQGQVCLFYSWTRADGTKSNIRECMDEAIILGSSDNPLQVGNLNNVFIIFLTINIFR